VLDLIERYAPEQSLPGPLRAYGRLAAHDASRVVGLLTTPVLDVGETTVYGYQSNIRNRIRPLLGSCR
jgi:hypothetical protein